MTLKSALKMQAGNFKVDLRLKEAIPNFFFYDIFIIGFEGFYILKHGFRVLIRLYGGSGKSMYGWRDCSDGYI